MTDKCFRVVIWFDDKYGLIEYEAEQKKIKVIFNDQEKRTEIENYLSRNHQIRIDGQNIRDFTEKLIRPADSLDSFKRALTRLWENTGVLVCWSNPV